MTPVFVVTFQDIFGLIAAVGFLLCYGGILVVQWWNNRKAKK